MTTFADVVSKVTRILGTGVTITDALVYDSLFTAQVDILTRIENTKTTTLTADESTVTFALPSDCYKVNGLLNTDDDIFIPMGQIKVGGYFGEYPNTNNFILYPEGSLTFADAPADNHTLYYTAYFDMPDDEDDDDFVLEVPDRALPALYYYTAAYCLVPSAIDSASLRQFGTKIDSGTPVHNPLKDMVEFLIKLGDLELSKNYLESGGSPHG